MKSLANTSGFRSFLQELRMCLQTHRRDYAVTSFRLRPYRQLYAKPPGVGAVLLASSHARRNTCVNSRLVHSAKGASRKSPEFRLATSGPLEAIQG